MDASSISMLTLLYLHQAIVTGHIPSQVSFDPIQKQDTAGNPYTVDSVSLNPSSPLDYSTEYQATIKGGASGVKNENGTALASDYTWTFTTMAQPPSSTDPHPFIAKWGKEIAADNSPSLME